MTETTKPISEEKVQSTERMCLCPCHNRGYGYCEECYEQHQRPVVPTPPAPRTEEQ
jgi:hypothetical protein